MRDWLIVGGGLHGSHIARRLQAACPQAAVAVIDPAASALAAWRRRADACGMRFLRSSQAHHLGLKTAALRIHARENGYGREHSLGRYLRPSRALFEDHARTVAAPVDRIATHVEALEPVNGGWRIHAADGRRRQARNVVLAPGPAAPAQPHWGRQLPHLFDDDFAAHCAGRAATERIVVIGGGLTGVQYALDRADAGHEVTVIAPHRPRFAAFDSDPCNAGPACLVPFRLLPIEQRPQALERARNPGTVPADIHARLTAQLARGAIRWQQGMVRSLGERGPQLADGRTITADEVILATGFQPRVHELIERTAQRLELPLVTPALTRIDADLAWAPGLYVAGGPASLQLGAMAGNIRGAQLAGKRLARVAGAAERLSPASAALP